MFYLNSVYYSPNEDLNLPDVIENIIFETPYKKDPCGDGFEEVAMGSVVSCIPLGSLGAEEYDSLISPDAMGSIGDMDWKDYDSGKNYRDFDADVTDILDDFD